MTDLMLWIDTWLETRPWWLLYIIKMSVAITIVMCIALAVS